MSQKENKEKRIIENIPVIALRGMPLFPGMSLHFDISRPDSLSALNYAMENGRNVFLVQQRNYVGGEPSIKDLFLDGCFAEVKQSLKINKDVTRVMVEVKERGRIEDVSQKTPFLLIKASQIESFISNENELKVILKLLYNSFQEYLSLTNTDLDIVNQSIDFFADPETAIDLVAANLNLDVPKAQNILAQPDLYKRIFDLYKYVLQELEFLNIERSIDERVRDELDKNQREFVLREQIRVIQDELGEDDESQIKNYYDRLDSMEVPNEVREKVESEINRLKKMPYGSSESGIIESYIDWILDLPWNISDEINTDVSAAREILDKDHYGLENVKERILEYLSVLHLTDSLKSPIICLVGAPGVGKTSIAKSIARATGRKFVRLSLGGLRDEAEIRGHRRTYLGSIPGRFIYHLKSAKANNPLILLDEVDKMSQDFKGDPASALLEVLDPEQNNTFTDNYLELPFDLSNVFFITTANSTASIPEPLLDRMELIEVNGYVSSEKMEIAKRYLIPELLREHGLDSKQLKITKNALEDIISYFTRESGVRELKRKIAQICRIAAKEIVEDNKESVTVTRKNLEDYLGKKKFLFDKAEKKGSIGLVTGLAWTSVGGETLQIETNNFPGKGKIQITGQLGDVMQESAQAAISFIRSQAKRLKIDENFYQNKDIHIHVPEGAVPKDGPSAGITIATSVLSSLLQEPVDSKTAMTGEITLRGRVLPIGGLREKLAAAHRAGIKKIIFPKDNEGDLSDIPKEIVDSFELYPVSHMNEVIDLIFEKK